ncbi:GDSL-type esterase/lipase family protein [Domibacillus indicus]|uniref:GDSL-type esterase/lipase family protein n=1 Tax=Domibacillus indicus TaxID=1437523 RepID=UPI0020417B00|nr:GDSL-type esterase/lipase family protein [Domibacillus indicus]MCM3788154.1 GDSL-type esterase/lipase family protein [Domibacillus indicus]
MKKPLNVLAASLVAGVVFASSMSPAFAETEEDIVPVPEENAPQPSQPTDDLPPLDLGIGVTRFTDVPSKTELAYAVQFLDQNGIARGYTKDYQTVFGVNDPIKRVDFAVILGTYMPIDTGVPNAGFRDLPARAVRIVSALKYKGIANGKTATYFGAAESITRGEAAVMLYNAFKGYFDDSEAIKNPFTDAVSRYAEPVRVLHGAGIIKGISSTKFGTNDSITRGQFAMLIHRIFQQEQKLRNEKKSGFVAFGDSNTSGSYFDAQFPASLGKKWTDQVASVYGDGRDDKVYNAGASGDETDDAMARFKAKVLDAKPQSVTLMFGINDALLKPNGQPQVDKEKFKQNLTYMIEQLRVRDIKVVLMTNTPIVEKTYYALELEDGRNVAPLYAKLGGLRSWVNSYNDIIREVGQKLYVPVVDVHNILVAKAGASTDSALIKSGYLDGVTGIHMTPKANDIVAREVKKVLAVDEYFPSKQDGLSMNIEKTSYQLSEIRAMPIKVTIKNESDVTYRYQPAFTIQKLTGSDWVTLDYSPGFVPQKEMYSIEANKSASKNISLKMYLPVTEGRYRIIQEFESKEGRVKLSTDYFNITNIPE